MKTILLTLCLTLSLKTTLAAQKNFMINQGDVEFSAKGFPTFITIKGTTQKLEGKLMIEGMKTEGHFTIPLNTLKTGMDLRDDHMINKYLEAKKFPQATLVLKPFELKEEGEAMGTLELHGMKKPVTISYTSTKASENTVNIDSSFKIKLTNFAIDIPSFQGITVAEDLAVNVKFKAIQK